MTIEELKEHCIKVIKMNEAIATSLNARVIDNRGTQEHKMVLRLIEAWEKIKEEIKDLDLGFVDEEYQAGVAYGIMKITKIIDKHLSEVSK